MELNERLRQLLEHHGLTQAGVASELGVSPSTVSGWLSGASACSELQLTRVVLELLTKLPPEAKQVELAELFRLRQHVRISRDDLPLQRHAN